MKVMSGEFGTLEEKLDKNQSQTQYQQKVENLYKTIFSLSKYPYKVNSIQLSQLESIQTVFIPCINLSIQEDAFENYYLCHGFGGSSMMFFPIFYILLQKGNIVCWEIRGMGLGQKLNTYNIPQTEIQQFFTQPIQKMLQFYQHGNCTMICPSFSGYITLMHAIRQERSIRKFIKQLILLSPVGITQKQEDYKNSIKSVSDIYQKILNKVGWTFKLTYKSLLRTLSRCCKGPLIRKGLDKLSLSSQQIEVMQQIIETLVELPDGSQCLFFDYFLPRVLPIIPIEPLLVREPQINIKIIHGGADDWVDKGGSVKIKDRFPARIQLTTIDNIGHNIPFHFPELKDYLQGLVAQNQAK